MEPETAEIIAKIFGAVENLERVAWFAAHLIWITIYYILYQMFKLKFLKLMITAEGVGIVFWIWSHLYYFTGVPEEQNTSLGYTTLVLSANLLLRITPLVLVIIGGSLGLKYLREKWKNMTANPNIEPMQETPVD